MDKKAIYLTHVLVSAPIFIYFGHFPEIKNDWVAYGLMALGGIVMLYHLFRLYTAWNLGFINWVNVIHFLVVGPLLIFAGWSRNLTYPWNQIFIVLGYGVLVNFVLKMVKK